MLVAGRRFGKTYLAVPELLRMAWGDGREAWYIAPTYKQARRDLWRPLKKIAKPWTAGKPNETTMTLDLVNGGRIALQGADNYDSLRGAGLNGLVLDEFADIALEAWTEALRPMLSDRMGRALFIGTPEGYNHFYDLYNRALEQPDWAAYQFTTIQGGNVPASEIEAAKRDLDLKTFLQEYEASFQTSREGRAYYAFDRAANVKAVEFNPRIPLCWTLDFNNNPMCSAICQIERGVLNVLEEIILPDSDTMSVAKVFRQRLDKYLAKLREGVMGVVPISVNIYGDPAGNQKQHAGTTDWLLIRSGLAGDSLVKTDFHVSYQEVDDKSIRNRVNTVNSRIKNAAGQCNMFVHPSCRALIQDLEQVIWKTDSTGKSTGELDSGPKNQLTHVSDALGYLVRKEFPLEIQSGYRAPYLGV